MSFKYKLLKTLVRLIGFKNKSFAGGTEAIIASAKARNTKNPIPELRDAEINVERITIDGCPVLRVCSTAIPSFRFAGRRRTAGDG